MWEFIVNVILVVSLIMNGTVPFLDHKHGSGDKYLVK